MPTPSIAVFALCAVFLSSVTLVFAIWLLVAESGFLERRTVKKRLLYMTAGVRHGQEKIILYRDELLQEASLLVRLAFALPRSQDLDRMLLAAGLSINALFFILGSLTLMAVGWLAGIFLLKDAMLALLLAGSGGLLPYMVLQMRIRQVRERFLAQFPDALDLLARALRAGHAMTTGLAMVSEEMSSPLKEEFGAVVDEINFGLSFKDALMNMCERMPLPDVNFFAVATLIQRETGGNLAEVMNSISHIIRGRVQFKRQVKTLTADGRVSATILLGLPVLMFGYLYLVNFDYVSLLWREEIGRYLSVAGTILMLAGAYVIHKMVDIEG